MACELCGRSACTRCFHSLSDQEDFDNKGNNILGSVRGKTVDNSWNEGWNRRTEGVEPSSALLRERCSSAELRAHQWRIELLLAGLLYRLCGRFRSSQDLGRGCLEALEWGHGTYDTRYTGGLQ